jgi:hypothetical protein
MDSDDTFWLKLWQAIIGGVVMVAAVVGGCTAHSNQLTAEAIRGGADPIRVQCALSANPNQTNCAISAATR